MSDDLAKRLRGQMCNRRDEQACGCSLCSVLNEAADLIAALTAENEHLRDYWYRQGKDDQHQVDAARIEALTAENERLREALAEVLNDNDALMDVTWIRRARAALAGDSHDQ